MRGRSTPAPRSDFEDHPCVPAKPSAFAFLKLDERNARAEPVLSLIYVEYQEGTSLFQGASESLTDYWNEVLRPQCLA